VSFPDNTFAARAGVRGNRRKDTAFERDVRRRLWAAGMRYRVDYSPIVDRRRKADIVFIGARIAIFLDGCFWHMCPDHCRMGKDSTGFWQEKLEANARRDLNTSAMYEAEGWAVLRFWEHEDVASVVERVMEALRSRAA
jgi:DNA mismatch endonuclease, patch repair protein